MPSPATQSFGQFRVPQTAAEFEMLKAQRSEMSRQVSSVRDRRQSIARQYESATGANRAGLDQQLHVLDQRILQIESDIGESGRALTAYTGPTAIVGVPDRFPIMNLGSGQITAISIVFVVCVLGPLAGSMGRLLWRRGAKPALPAGWNDAPNRLERLEQAVDTIAVEMERVSEGQRFLTKIMTQPDAPEAGAGSAPSSPASTRSGQSPRALGAGQPEGIVLQNQRDEVRIRRS